MCAQSCFCAELPGKTSLHSESPSVLHYRLLSVRSMRDRSSRLLNPPCVRHLQDLGKDRSWYCHLRLSSLQMYRLDRELPRCCASRPPMSDQRLDFRPEFQEE